MILLYPKKRKNKDTFFIFQRAAGTEGSAGAAGGGRLGSSEATHKKKPQGRNSSFAPRASGEGAAPLPRNDGLTLPPRGAHRLFRAAGGRGWLISRRHRSAGGSALPKRREKETAGGGTVLSRRRQRAKARLAPPKRRAHIAPSRGTQALSRPRRPRTAYFAASLQRGRPNSSEASTKRNLRGGTVLSRRRQRAKARPRSPETTGSHCPLAGHTSSFAPPAAADGLFRGVTAARAARQSGR